MIILICYLALFSFHMTKIFTLKNVGYFNNVTDAEVCARKCLSIYECLSFDFASDRKGNYKDQKT